MLASLDEVPVAPEGRGVEGPGVSTTAASQEREADRKWLRSAERRRHNAQQEHTQRSIRGCETLKGAASAVKQQQ